MFRVEDATTYHMYSRKDGAELVLWLSFLEVFGKRKMFFTF